MTRSALLRTTCALLFLSLLPLFTACEYRPVTVRIADFESALVDGVRFWRLAEGTGQYEPVATLEFGEFGWMRNREIIEYTHIPSGDQEVVNLAALVSRDEADPDAITLQVQYLRMENAGWFRITTFNAAGESPLSNEHVYL